MQVKTFVYGTPLGFNFYEDDSQYKDYFKGFYISSREGRQLMVNRLDNGETTYNFLCYRIAEYGNRPNAFFGMSFVLNDYLYCSDFGNLYDWFNFLFDKLISERKLITKQGEELHYNVAKFEEDKDDVDWLKSNMPNILSSPDIKLQKYDASFSDKKTGKVAQFNNSEKPDIILKAFKQSRWICLSSLFGGEPEPELDFGELSQFVETITKQLLPIAINPEKKHVPVLKEMHSALNENYKSISEFVQKTRDEDRKKMFQELGLKYYDIFAKQLPQIAQKIDMGQSEPPKPPTTRECSKCGMQKPLSAFADGDTICIECRAHERNHEETRICQKCGKKKPIAAFKTGDTICIECREHESSHNSSGFVLPRKYLYGGIAVAAIAIIALCVYFGRPFKEGKSGGDTNDKGNPTPEVIANNKVQESDYNGFIANKQFLEAYDCIKDKDDVDTYKPRLKDDYENYLITLEFNKIQREMIQNNSLCEDIGIDTEQWNQFAEDGDQISYYLSREEINPSDKQKCEHWIKPYKNIDLFKDIAQTWERELKKKKVKQLNGPSGEMPVTIIAKVCDSDGKEVKLFNIDPSSSNQGKIEIQGTYIQKVGSYIEVNCSNKPSLIDHKDNRGDEPEITGESHHYKITIKNSGKWLYKCDQAEITITTPTYLKQ